MAFTNSVTQNGDFVVIVSDYKPPLDFPAVVAGKEFTRLHIYGKPRNLKHLSTLTNLIELRMQSTKLTNFSLLAGMNRLEELIYGSGSLKECDLAFAAGSLTSLWLTDHRSLANLHPIGICTRLKKLSLRNLPHVQSYIDLKSLPRLELLALRNLRRWPSLAGLGEAKSLQKLFLDQTKIEDGIWEHLVKMKLLEYVSGLEDAFGKEAATEFRSRRPDVQTPRRFPA